MWSENRISFLIRFDALITGAVDAFPLNLGLDLNFDNVSQNIRALDNSTLPSVKSSSSRAGTIPQESCKRKQNVGYQLLMQKSYFVGILSSAQALRYHKPIVT